MQVPWIIASPSPMTIFRKNVSSDPEKSSERRSWRRKKSGAQRTVKKKRKTSSGWTTKWSVEGAEKFAVAKARLQERFSNLTNWIYYQFYTCTHPCSPLRRRAAKRSKEQSKLGAAERRMQKEAMARTKSAEKRGRLLEKDSEHAKLLQ